MGTKFSALPSASTLTGSEIVPMVQSGADVTATVTQILAGASGGFASNAQIPVGTGARYYFSGHRTVDFNPSSAIDTNILIPAVNTLYAFPIMFTSALTLTALGFVCTTYSSGTFKCGLYSSSATTNLPTTLLASVTGLSGTGALSGTISQAVTANKLYWLAAFTDGTNNKFSLMQPNHNLGFTSGTASATSMITGVTCAQTFTSGLPSTFGTASMYASYAGNAAGTGSVGGVFPVFVSLTQ